MVCLNHVVLQLERLWYNSLNKKFGEMKSAFLSTFSLLNYNDGDLISRNDLRKLDTFLRLRRHLLYLKCILLDPSYEAKI